VMGNLPCGGKSSQWWEIFPVQWKEIFPVVGNLPNGAGNLPSGGKWEVVPQFY